mmetsp:Transcript_41452/g.118564  ORF Transcript_41452/g.118564 Transcript_41452/m.118564 type:complete len:242 (+) Transcript_41452:84-809(+)
MQSRSVPWYAACCRTLALRRSSWTKLDDAWEEQSVESDARSTKSGSNIDSCLEAYDDSNPNDWDCRSTSVQDHEEFFSDGASVDDSAAETLDDTAAFLTELPDFSGRWVCKSTWGLEDFLKTFGASRMQRLAATKAPWPEWDFEQLGDHFVFVNRGALGDLREEFSADGTPYTSRDGWKQKVRSSAHWEGSVLVIDREGSQGCFRESRSIDAEGRLQFRLHAFGDDASGMAWGRTFERKLV